MRISQTSPASPQKYRRFATGANPTQSVSTSSPPQFNFHSRQALCHSEGLPDFLLLSLAKHESSCRTMRQSSRITTRAYVEMLIAPPAALRPIVARMAIHKLYAATAPARHNGQFKPEEH